MNKSEESKRNINSTSDDQGNGLLIEGVVYDLQTVKKSPGLVCCIIDEIERLIKSNSEIEIQGVLDSNQEIEQEIKRLKQKFISNEDIKQKLEIVEGVRKASANVDHVDSWSRAE